MRNAGDGEKRLTVARNSDLDVRFALRITLAGKREGLASRGEARVVRWSRGRDRGEGREGEDEGSLANTARFPCFVNFREEGRTGEGVPFSICSPFIHSLCPLLIAMFFTLFFLSTDFSFLSVRASMLYAIHFFSS